MVLGFADISVSECRCFQPESAVFRQSEHQVHVLDSLSGGSFQQIVDGADDICLVSAFPYRDQGFVGVHAAFHVYVFLFGYNGERCIHVVVSVDVVQLLLIGLASGVDAGENPSGEISPYRDKIYFMPEFLAGELPESLPYFRKVLVREYLV